MFADIKRWVEAGLRFDRSMRKVHTIAQQHFDEHPWFDGLAWAQACRISRVTVLPPHEMYADIKDERDHGRSHEDDAILGAIASELSLGRSASGWRGVLAAGPSATD